MMKSTSFPREITVESKMETKQYTAERHASHAVHSNLRHQRTTRHIVQDGRERERERERKRERERERERERGREKERTRGKHIPVRCHRRVSTHEMVRTQVTDLCTECIRENKWNANQKIK